MTPAELHAWVVAQWQAKLDTARAATPWPDVGVVVESTDQGVPFVASELTVAHIAAFDPTFAIAVCDAALRRLERHAPVTRPQRPDGMIAYTATELGEFKTWMWTGCDACRHRGGWPCPEVLDDASPFAGQPDFPEELR